MNKTPQQQERLHEVLLEYVEAVQNGTPPDRRRFLAAHAEFAAELAEFFKSYDEVDRITRPLRDNEPPAPNSLVPTPVGDATEASGIRADGVQAELGRLGDYRLLREIGRGGMGIVYEAEQISLRRHVALKVLPFAAGIDSRQLQRFRNEAEAAAHLHHSHIVPVFAVGAERGVHYYAMQFIEGQSLAALIADLRHQAGQRDEASPALAAPPKEQATADDAQSSLTQVSGKALYQTAVAATTAQSRREGSFYRTVARIGKDAAEALEYAHQMGVIHRDIKSANLLLDERGDVWIADFGLAQFQSHAGVTMTGELLGTLRYVSPEQALAKRGLVDHRTDIYSLGATLYELLTLQPVFDGRDRHDLLHQIAFAEPRPARALEPAIPPELETIVLKALAKTPADRYASAQDMADDLQRFLDDKPILAKRPSLVERSRKWMRRHPSFVAAALLLLLFGVVGFAVSTAMIAAEQARTRDAFEREKQRAVEAEQRFQLAKRSADEMIQIAEEELSDHPAMHKLRRRLLETALAYYQEFIEQRRADPDAQIELAATRDRVRKILDDLVALQGASKAVLLKEPAVREDLGLTANEEQRLHEQWGRWHKQFHETFREFHRLSREERQQQLLELARAQEAAFSALLTPAQLERLKQIARQMQGLQAFSEPDVQSTLKLTSEQRKQIRAAQAGAALEQAEPDVVMKAARVALGGQERRRGAMAKVLKVLTPEQLKAWQELTGPEYVGPEPMILPPGPPPGPPPHFGPQPWHKEPGKKKK